MIGSNLLRYKENQIYIAKDWETEGLNLVHSRPWQLSYIVFTLKEIIDRKTYYIWFDDLKISDDAKRITNFNYEEYKKKAVDPKEVIVNLDKYVYDPNIISLSHNLFHFDSHIHQIIRKITGFPKDYSYLLRAIDTLALSKAYKKSIKIEDQNLCIFQYRMLSIVEKTLKTKLSTMAKEFHISIDESKLHDASVDTEILVELFKKLIWMIEI